MKSGAKRIWAVLLVLVLILLMTLPGCKEDGPVTLRIVTESIGQTEDGWATPRGIDQITQLVLAYRKTHENVDVVLEQIPFSGEARLGKLEQLRTELMAGKGPDVLILPGGSVLTDMMGMVTEGLIPDVEMAMRNGMFADISEYYDADTELGKESLNTTVMDAGIVDGARYVLPLRYDFPVACVNMDAFSKTGLSTDIFNGTVMTFMEAALQTNDGLADSMQLDPNMLFLENLLPKAVDYDAQQVLLTKEQLINFVQTYWTYFQKCRRVEDYPQHAWLGNFGKPELDITEGFWLNSWINMGYWMCVEPLDRTIHAVARAKSVEAELQMFPLRATDGKLVADVTVYGAISAGCKNPEIAYDFLRQLLLEDFQWERNTEVNTAAAYLAAQGWPVRTKDSVANLVFSLSKDIPFDISSGRKGLLLSLTDADVPVLTAQIDEVVFPTTWYGSLDNDIIGMYWGEKNRNETANADALAEQQLKNLEWHLAES